MEVPRDCEGVARVRSTCFPAWPVSADEVADTEARRPRDRLHVAWVAVQQDEITGYGYVEEPNSAARPGRIRIRVLVAPEHRSAGLGGALYEALERNAPELRTFNDAVNDAILGLNLSLGFRVEAVEIRYRKDVR